LNKFIALFLFASLLLASCSSSRPTGKTEAEILYKEAQMLMKDGRYLMATEKLNSLRSQFPYSYFATHSELLQADILFEQENFVEAAASYILFKDFHPRHKRTSYVLWRIAESFNSQRPASYDRDLSPLYEAIKYYDELLRVFPKSDFTKGGREKIAECRLLLQKKEQYIADFYYKTEVFQAARHRYLDILDSFTDRELRNHSINRVLRSSMELKEPEMCKKHYKKYSSEVTGLLKEQLSAILEDCTRS
jgi:outer membrane protein assembly factor BamD